MTDVHKFQVVSIATYKAFFTGSFDECTEWINDYGLGNSQFQILPYFSGREYGDITETY